jgi:hypothetical protein
MHNKKKRHESRFLETPLIRQADGELKNISGSGFVENIKNHRQILALNRLKKEWNCLVFI